MTMTCMAPRCSRALAQVLHKVTENSLLGHQASPLRNCAAVLYPLHANHEVINRMV